jgi:hypothetical protein
LPRSEWSAGHCAAETVRRALIDFSHAFNQGDAQTLDEVFATEPSFRWYSSGKPGERLNEDAHRRETLLAYFRDRHDSGDSLALRSYRFQGNAAGVGHFNGTFRRSASEYRSGASFVVAMKGAALCRGRGAKFVVLSLGGPR